MTFSCIWDNDFRINFSGSVQQGGDSASLVTVYAALRPGDGFSHPHQEHTKDTYIPAPEFDAEILVPYARKVYQLFGTIKAFLFYFKNTHTIYRYKNKCTLSF